MKDSEKLKQAFRREPRRPLGYYTEMALRSVESEGLGPIAEVLEDSEIPDQIKAAAVRALPKLEGFEPLVLALIESADCWSRTLTLQKLATCTCSLATQQLWPLLMDHTEVSDIGVSYRISSLAALALAHQAKANPQILAELSERLENMEKQLESSNLQDRRWAAMLFSELGDPRALQVLDELIELERDDPFQELTRLRQRLQQRNHTI